MLLRRYKAQEVGKCFNLESNIMSRGESEGPVVKIGGERRGGGRDISLSVIQSAVIFN